MAHAQPLDRAGDRFIPGAQMHLARALDSVRVFVVDDYPLVRRGLAAMLEAERCLQWVGEAASGEEALRAAAAHAPDVVVVDQDMPGIDGVQLIEALRPLLPDAGFVLLSGCLEDIDLRRAIAAGATCILLKNACSQEVVNAIQAAHRGQTLHPLAATADAGDRSAELGADLTRRECDLLELMARGLGNQDIATRLQIAMPTVKFHVTNILRKLQAENRTAAVLIALRHRIVALN